MHLDPYRAAKRRPGDGGEGAGTPARGGEAIAAGCACRGCADGSVGVLRSSEHRLAFAAATPAAHLPASCTKRIDAVLGAQVLREYHAVSYKWLSRDQGISPNQAKRCLGAGGPRAEPRFARFASTQPPRSSKTTPPRRCLFKFARDAGDKVICTYCVTGRHLSGVGVTLVVGADRLEEAKRSLEHLTGIHVHW